MIQALNTRVLLKLTPRKEKVGLIHVPDSAKRTSATAEVISVGSEVMVLLSGVPMLKPGDKVYFARYSGSEVEVPEDPKGEYILIDQSDIYAKETDG